MAETDTPGLMRVNLIEMGAHDYAVRTGERTPTPDARDATIARLREALAPFALISSERVITDDVGYVTVRTQAEYFHRARAALEDKHDDC